MKDATITCEMQGLKDKYTTKDVPITAFTLKITRVI